MTDNAQVSNLVNLLDGYATKGHTFGCAEASGELSAAYDQGIRLCRELYQADTGAAGGRYFQNVPRGNLRSCQSTIFL